MECGHCFECRKKKRREWRIRNYEQLKETPHAVFFTGTVSPQRYEHICKQYGYKNDGSQDNEIITKIQRLFLERIRKEKGYSIKHWCVTEKGHTNTRRIHIHGLYYATHGETLEGIQIWEDTILKRYNIKKTERRLLIEITYNLEKSQKEYFENLQLNLFDNENHR